jgi:hypothetical protein
MVERAQAELLRVVASALDDLAYTTSDHVLRSGLRGHASKLNRDADRFEMDA